MIAYPCPSIDISGVSQRFPLPQQPQWSQQPMPQWIDPAHKLLQMIAMRMHYPDGSTYPFAFISAYKINEERVAVFLVVHDEPLIIEDEWPLFPSDRLITQLRMLERK
jgi:hypothetical protein